MPELLEKDLWFRADAQHSSAAALANGALYISASVLFVIGSVLFYPDYTETDERLGVWLFVIASVMFLVGSLQDLHDISASILRNRVDQALTSYALLGLSEDMERPQSGPLAMSEGCFTVLFNQPFHIRRYIMGIFTIGNVLFVLGSCLFFPRFGEKFERGGIWLFVAGSILFVLGTAWDLLWVYAHRPAHRASGQSVNVTLRWIIAIGYVSGSFCFIVGSLFFLPGIKLLKAGVVLFVLGSACFLLAAMTNAAKRHLYPHGDAPSQKLDELEVPLADEPMEIAGTLDLV
eukprot:m.305249 g.305249  ORF g.305249 m.305249 type:complete len:290 (-) comp17649_c0_seq1:29-898(-)